jgi:hypothetical protein
MAGSALTAKDRATAGTIFETARDRWLRLRAVRRDEALMDEELHLVGALSCAVEAADALEARRIYDLMSPEYKEATDRADSLQPGSLKIWDP